MRCVCLFVCNYVCLALCLSDCLTGETDRNFMKFYHKRNFDQ